MQHARAPLYMLAFWLFATMAWWAFAFAPFSGGVEPQWLASAKNACFGTLSNGLPDTYGWMVLILAPGSFLVGLVIAWFEELTLAFKLFFQNKNSRIVLLVIISAVFFEAYLVAGKIQKGIEITNFDFSSNEKGELPEGYPQTNKPAPQFKLFNQHGKLLDSASLIGRPTIVTFAFAHCSTVCPLLVHQAIQAMNQVKDAQLVIISLDPWRDTVSTLPEIAAKWKITSDNVYILSGPVDIVSKTIEDYAIPTSRDLKTGEVTHPPMVYVLNSKGEIAYTFNNPPPHWLVEAIERLNKIGNSE